jgi:hypothetical protein
MNENCLKANNIDISLTFTFLALNQHTNDCIGADTES